MAVIKQIKHGPGVLTIGDAAMAKAIAPRVASVTLKTKTDADDDTVTLSGDVVAGDVTETHTLEGNMFGDWGETDSFQEFCFEHRGEVLPFVYQPLGPTKKGIEGDVQIASVEIGGEAGKTMKPDFEFKVLDPKIKPATPAT
ncbi:hypothetical protein HJ590_12110 [Naumannella sp. ID2617S]|nr:hypothetical protein [Naumannella sp. ID2617S]